MLKISPFVKWAGGKRQLLNKINCLVPEYNRIVEPFVGGGAFFLDKKPDISIVNDINFELITSYKVIKDYPYELMKLLNNYEKKNSKIFFYEIRKRNVPLNKIAVAARFIYLNKTSFNGIYRVNSKNEFNVPYNNKDNVKTYDENNILNLNKFFNESNIEFYNYSYEKIFEFARKGDFFFIDPPYDKEKENTFTSYQKNNFGTKEQIELSLKVDELDRRGIKFILTNHNTQLINRLYKKYNIITIRVNRLINSKGNKRINNTEEVLIYNFEIEPSKKRDLEFENFMTGMNSTNLQINRIVDWKKVFENREGIIFSLNQLSVLISEDTETFIKKVEELYLNNPEVFSILPYLLAVRDKDFDIYDLSKNLIKYDFKRKMNYHKILSFILDSDLKLIFVNDNLKSLSDYYLGVEVGLDTNARKNRNGSDYEKSIETLLKKYNISYKSQVTINDVFQIKSKVVDFLLEINNKKYIVEANFYNAGGSKLNSICGEYSNIIEKARDKGYEFIWVTDGKGWKTARRSLKEVFFNLEYLFNFVMFEDWLKKISGENINTKIE